MGTVKVVKQGITYPLGFKASGVSCGIKKGGKKDLAVIYSDVPAVAAGMFTTNKFKAAPVLLDLKHLKRGEAQVIVINSGCANACTGKRGEEDAQKMASRTAQTLGIKNEEVLVASTGVIGEYLPLKKIESGIKKGVKELSYKGGGEAAEAIMTTDTHPKEIALDTGIKGRGRKEIKIGGMAKGAGMIAPNMATLLAFLTTDACLTPAALRESLRIAVNESFNKLTIDGCMSTNDTVLIMANGLARNSRIKLKSESFSLFTESLTQACQLLTQKLAEDGEGASKLIVVKVKGAWDDKDAHRAAKAIANSALVKTAIYGGDPNWGRIVSAIGSVRIKFKPERVSLKLQDVALIKKGKFLSYEEKQLASSLKQSKTITIEVDLDYGPKEATVWSCDLTEEYIKINAHYKT